MIDRTHALPVSQQARLVGIARSSVYYQAQPVSEADQLLMRRIDELHLEYPFEGSRMLQGLLKGEGLEVGRLHVATACRHADEEDRHRGDLPSPEHVETSAGAQGLSLSPGQAGGYQTQSGLLVWTAPNSIAMCQNEFVESSIEGDRPWNRLFE